MASDVTSSNKTDNKAKSYLDDSGDSVFSAIYSSIGDKMFTLGVMIWSLHDFIKFSELYKMLPEAMPNYFRFAGLGLILISILTRRFLKLPALPTIILGVLLIFLMVNNGLLTGDYFWMDLIILIFGSLGINYSQFFVNVALYRIVLNVGLIVFALRGRIPNDISVAGTRVRFNLGYTWTSFAAHTLLFITLLLMWRYKKDAPFWLFLILGIANIWIYQKTNTKLPFALVFLALISWFAFSKMRQEKFTFMPIRLITVFIFPFLFFLIYYLSFHSIQYAIIDQLLSGRLSLGHTYISQYGLTSLGHHIYESANYDTIGQVYQTLDSSMMRYIIKYGLISTVIFNVLWGVTSWKITSKGNVYYDIILIILALEAFSDPWFLYPSYNIFLILIGIIIFDRKDLSEAVN